MAERKVLGNIGLGNFCKAVLEHKDIRLITKKDNFIIKFEYVWNGERYRELTDGDLWHDFDIISIFIKDIYKMIYTWEIM